MLFKAKIFTGINDRLKLGLPYHSFIDDLKGEKITLIIIFLKI
jgi:hypothetical protein